MIAKIGKEAGFQRYTTNFLNLLVEKDRLNLLAGICESFEEQYCTMTDTQVCRGVIGARSPAGHLAAAAGCSSRCTVGQHKQQGAKLHYSGLMQCHRVVAALLQCTKAVLVRSGVEQALHQGCPAAALERGNSSDSSCGRQQQAAANRLQHRSLRVSGSMAAATALGDNELVLVAFGMRSRSSRSMCAQQLWCSSNRVQLAHQAEMLQTQSRKAQ